MAVVLQSAAMFTSGMRRMPLYMPLRTYSTRIKRPLLLQNCLTQRNLFIDMKILRQGLVSNYAKQTNSIILKKSFCCSSSLTIDAVTKQDVRNALKDPSVVVIDVREQSEVAETGPLEHGGFTAKNIPLGYLQDALTYSEDDFLDEFGFEKPQRDSTIIFSCKAGVRSVMACRIAMAEGYECTKNYQGSALDWFS